MANGKGRDEGGSSWMSTDADKPQTGVWKCFSIHNAEYAAVRREVGLRSEMDIYEIVVFIRINVEQHRKQLKGCGSL